MGHTFILYAPLALIEEAGSTFNSILAALSNTLFEAILPIRYFSATSCLTGVLLIAPIAILASVILLLSSSIVKEAAQFTIAKSTDVLPSLTNEVPVLDFSGI